MRIEELCQSNKFKILIYLIEVGATNVSDISRRFSMNYRQLNKAIQELVSAGLIIEKRYGRARILEINREDPRIRALKNLVETFSKLYNYYHGNDHR